MSGLTVQYRFAASALQSCVAGAALGIKRIEARHANARARSDFAGDLDRCFAMAGSTCAHFSGHRNTILRAHANGRNERAQRTPRRRSTRLVDRRFASQHDLLTRSVARRSLAPKAVPKAPELNGAGREA